MDRLLDITELVAQNKSQEQIRLNIFESQLSTIHNLIKRRNANREREMIYTVPTMVMGKPKFDVDILRNYLYINLSDNGLKVDIQDRYHMYISWKETDINLGKYLQKKANLAQKHKSLYMEDMVAKPISQEQIDMLKFRRTKQQQIQRQTQEDRQLRFEMQRARMPQPDLPFGEYIERY